MKRTSVCLYVVVMLSLSSTFGQNQETASPNHSVVMRRPEAFGQLPLSFELNQGQTDNRVRFMSRGNGYVLFLAGNEAVLAMSNGSRQPPQAGRYPGVSSASNKPRRDEAARTAVLRMRLAGANPSPETVGLEELPGKSNYLIGRDPSKWRTNVPMYGKVKYREVYRGIDLVYYGHERQVEQDFVVQPGADPESIVLGFDGADKLKVDAHGDLVMQTAAGSIRQRRPFIYQEVNGVRQEVSGGYVLRSKHLVGFRVAAYDHNRSLVIDPVLVYSTYLGGSGNEPGTAIALDSTGNAYIAGGTLSSNFPTIAGAFETTAPGGSEDVFVTKLNPTGSGLVYSTYIGGSGSDEGAAIAVDSSGNAYVTGVTFSTDFPTTAGAFKMTAPNGLQAGFVTKLNPTGSGLAYSTYLGGSNFDYGGDIAVDSSGDAYVVGATGSTDFPTTPAALQPNGGQGGYVTKVNPAGSGLVYSTYIPSTNAAGGVAVDSFGDAYVIGFTTATDFPTTLGSFQTTNNGGRGDVFVMELNPTGSGLLYATYLGGSGEDGNARSIAVDSSGNAYVTGYTYSADFPTTVGAFQTIFAGTRDAFVTKLNPSGSSLVYSTFLGGSGSNDVGLGIAVDSSDNAYVIGITTSTNFPTTADALQTTHGGGTNDAFVTELNPAGSGLLYSTYLGGSGDDRGEGIALDSAPIPNVYGTGITSSSNFPTTVGAFQTTIGGGTFDAFIVKIGVGGNTPAGTNVPVQPVDTTTGTSPITLSFSTVTQSGTTTLTTSGTGAPPPAGFKLGNPPTYYQLSTTAAFSGSITICINYSGIRFGNQSNLKLFHFENGAWVNATTSLDTTRMIICGSVTSLSPFAVFEPVSATTTVLSPSANPAVIGQSVTLTAVVSSSGGSGTPSGTVTFNDGVTGLGTASLSGGRAALSTSALSLGSHSITAAYSGDSNFNGSASAALIELVQYEPAGATCFGAAEHQILQPINADGTSVWKQGRTIPAQFRVCDFNGSSVGTAGVVSSFFLTEIISGTVTTVDETVSSTTTDTAFRWDTTNQQWIFNISTKSLAANNTYVYTITLNDGTNIMFQYGLR